MNKSKKMLTGFILTAAVILAAAVLPAGFRSGDSRIYSGVPDVISTRTQNEKCTLTVVANSGEIRDQEAFARSAIKMYEANNFQTTKFSRDMGNVPRMLYITVYLTREDAAEDREAFRFSYDMSSRTLSVI